MTEYDLSVPKIVLERPQTSLRQSLEGAFVRASLLICAFSKRVC